MSAEARLLDKALLMAGEDIIVRRIVGVTNQVSVDVHCRAAVRQYAPQELVGTIIQGDTKVIISPSEIIRAQWPGGLPLTSPPSGTDPRVPRKNDKAIVAGKARNIEAAAPFYVAGELVRIELQVRG